MFLWKILKRNSEMLCVLVLVLTKYMVQCYLFLILSSSFSKHVHLHTKNNTIVQATSTPAMGVRDHVSCEHFEKLEQFGVLMHILKTFVLIHFRFYLLINSDIE